MKKALALALVLVSAVALAVVAGRAEAVPAKTTASLTGAGATFPFPLISKWIPAVDQALGIQITYASVGSGAGIAQITARTVDFGASDAPLTPDQLTACKGCVVIPWALAANGVMYNVPGLGKRLRLTGPTLANIYLGKITRWDDPALKAINPGANLPSTKITVVHRSDGSGTTYNFTEYLSSVSAAWKSQVGFSTAVDWPAGVGARGSSGVSGVVKSTEGAIGYADVAYSVQNKLTMAAMRNRSGQYTLGGLKNIQAALSQLPKKVTQLSQLKIVDPPKAAGKAAYPICTFTYVIVPTSSGDKAALLRKWIYWAVTQGQKFGPPLFFQPLPVSVQAFIYREIKKIQA